MSKAIRTFFKFPASGRYVGYVLNDGSAEAKRMIKEALDAGYEMETVIP